MGDKIFDDPFGGLGMPIVVTTDAVARDWIFPADRYVSYGPEDQWWAEKYGFGHWSEPRPCAYLLNGTHWLIHPILAAKIPGFTKSGA